LLREDKKQWAEAFAKEYRGFEEQNAFRVVRPNPGVRIHDTITRLEYKEDKGKARLCARGGQQVEGESFKLTFNPSDFKLYAPTLKWTEARQLAAIAAEHSCPHLVLKTDTRQAFLHGEIISEIGEDGHMYTHPLDVWPEPISDGHVLLLLKTMYSTKQAARLG
jgi:hypothetical protein